MPLTHSKPAVAHPRNMRILKDQSLCTLKQIQWQAIYMDVEERLRLELCGGHTITSLCWRKFSVILAVWTSLSCSIIHFGLINHLPDGDNFCISIEDNINPDQLYFVEMNFQTCKNLLSFLYCSIFFQKTNCLLLHPNMFFLFFLCLLRQSIVEAIGSFGLIFMLEVFHFGCNSSMTVTSGH